MLRAVARIDAGAIERNARRLKTVAGTRLCVVVKADGYGHGAVTAARAAQAGGADWLAVATAYEAAHLRASGIAGPLLVMGALSPAETRIALEAEADIVAWRRGFVDGLPDGTRVHVKLDTGMGRLGTRDLDEALAVAAAARDWGLLVGAMTHFATSDDDPDFAHAQLEAFAPFVAQLGDDVLVHAANSAGTLGIPASRFDMVRCGVAVYGLDPFQDDPADHGLEPAMTLASYVGAVKQILPGESAGYGRRFVAEDPTVLATIPIGYADGVRRGLSNNAAVLIGGRRRPLVGTVSMDNITVEAPDARVGDEVILIGAQGEARILAEEWAFRLGTINYEITCGVSARVPRDAV